MNSPKTTHYVGKITHVTDMITKSGSQFRLVSINNSGAFNTHLVNEGFFQRQKKALAVGNTVDMEYELRIAGTTQYKDAQGVERTHGVDAAGKPTQAKGTTSEGIIKVEVQDTANQNIFSEATKEAVSFKMNLASELGLVVQI